MKTKATPHKKATPSGSPASARPGRSFFQKKETKDARLAPESRPFFSGIQTRLALGKPRDRFEREADAMADKVVNEPGEESARRGTKRSPQDRPPLFGQITPVVQLKAAKEEEMPAQRQAEEEEVQAKTAEEEEVQTKAGEEEEMPAQRQAEEEEVQAKTAEEEEVQTKVGEEEEMPAQRQAEEEEVQAKTAEEEEVQTKVGEEEEMPAQRQAEEEEVQTKVEKEEELQAQRKGEEEELTAQTRLFGGIGDRLPKIEISRQLRALTGEGSPLPDRVRKKMENRFGADFSSVRIHTDSEAVQLSRGLRALAFAHGRRIFFNLGKFSPFTRAGEHLLAHELTHTIQQGAVPEKAPEESPVQVRVEGEGNLSVEAREQAAGGVGPEPKPPTGGEPAEEPATPVVPQGEATPLPAGQPAAGEAGKAEEEGAEEATKAPSSPEEDPAFQGEMEKVKQKGAQQRKHAPAQTESGAAQSAARPPANEKESLGKGRQVDKMEQEDPGEFSVEAFIKALKERIEQITPKNLKDIDQFKEKSGLKQIKQEVTSTVAKEKTNAAGPIEARSKEEPTTEGIEGKPVEPLPERPPAPGAGRVAPPSLAPKSKTPHEVEIPLRKESQSLDDEMAQNEVTETQLQESEEPEFNKALESKKEAQTKTAESLVQYREEEVGMIDQQGQEAGTEGKSGLFAFAAKNKSAFGEVDGQQKTTIGKDELKRQEIANQIESIYTKTKTEVETLLSELDVWVNTEFETGSKQAQKRFEDYVHEQKSAYKSRRYSGVRGKFRWVRDKFKGLPSEVNRFYEQGRDQYIKDMDALVRRMAVHIQAQLKLAKEKTKAGKDKVKEFVDGLGEEVKKFGQEALESIMDRFDDLEQSIKNKQGQLIETLAQKYSEGLKQIDEKIEKMKEDDRGLIDKAIGFIKKVINTIRKLKDLLVSIAKRIAGVIGKIIAAPGRFFKNLGKAVKMGFDLFWGNIKKHLATGIMAWLFGLMRSDGIKLPEQFDLKGIASLLLQVLNITYAAIRVRAVQILGEGVVARLEKVSEVFLILVKEGPVGLYNYAIDKFGEMKEKLLADIKEYTMQQILWAGIKWVLSLFNPVAAFIKACMAIYRAISFVINSAEQFAAFINSILDSLEAIVEGRIEGAAKKIEQSLALALPLAIGLLAAVLGLGGIPGKVRAFAQNLRNRINRVIDTVIQKAFNLAMKAGKLFMGTKAGKLVAKGSTFVKEKVKQAKEKGAKGVAKLKGKVVAWWKARKTFTGTDGKLHSLYFKGSGTAAALTLASNPQPYTTFLNGLEIDPTDKEKNEARGEALKIAGSIEKEKQNSAPKGISDAAKEQFENDKQKKIDGLLNQLRTHTVKLFGKNIPNWRPPTFMGVNSAGFGVGMQANLLTRVKIGSGSKPTSSNTSTYEVLNKRRESPGGASYYVKGHLLNEKLGGKGVWENLTPLSRSGNHQHEAQFESIIKAAVNAGAVIEYHVTPVYLARGDKNALKKKIDDSNTPGDATIMKNIVDAEDSVPTGLTCQMYTLEVIGKDKFNRIQPQQNWSVLNGVARKSDEYYLSSSQKFVTVNINSATVSELLTIPGISASLANNIYNVVSERDQPFGRYEVLVREVNGLDLATVMDWNQKGYVKL